MNLVREDRSHLAGMHAVNCQAWAWTYSKVSPLPIYAWVYFKTFRRTSREGDLEGRLDAARDTSLVPITFQS